MWDEEVWDEKKGTEGVSVAWSGDREDVFWEEGQEGMKRKELLKFLSYFNRTGRVKFPSGIGWSREASFCFEDLERAGVLAEFGLVAPTYLRWVGVNAPTGKALIDPEVEKEGMLTSYPKLRPDAWSGDEDCKGKSDVPLPSPSSSPLPPLPLFHPSSSSPPHPSTDSQTSHWAVPRYLFSRRAFGASRGHPSRGGMERPTRQKRLRGASLQDSGRYNRVQNAEMVSRRVYRHRSLVL